jgi:hypothetical protein
VPDANACPREARCPSSGISLEVVLRLPERHPPCRRREAQPDSCTERENLIGDAKGKGASGSNRDAESTDAPGRGGLLPSSDEAGVMPVEQRERAIAIWLGSTGNGSNPMFNGKRQPSRGGTSRMTRECQVRFCEGLGVKFPGPTRQSRRFDREALAAVSLFALPPRCVRLDDGRIRKSSSFFPDLSFAVSQRGCLPRPAQVSEGLSGFRYLGRTRG